MTEGTHHEQVPARLLPIRLQGGVRILTAGGMGHQFGLNTMALQIFCR